MSEMAFHEKAGRSQVDFLASFVEQGFSNETIGPSLPKSN